MNSLSALADVQANAERVLNTPLPVGYNILIHQIVLLYVYLLPFQLYTALGWVTIPGTVAAAYIILGLAAIGNELENPFGNDVNDLPLDSFCEELRRELDYMTSNEPPKLQDFFWGTQTALANHKEGGSVHSHAGENQVLWPLSNHGANMWKTRSTAEIRGALKTKVTMTRPHSRDGGSVTKVSSQNTSTAKGSPSV